MSKSSLNIRPYVPEPTAARFHRDNSDIRGVMGPVGTGKTERLVNLDGHLFVTHIPNLYLLQ